MVAVREWKIGKKVFKGFIFLLKNKSINIAINVETLRYIF